MSSCLVGRARMNEVAERVALACRVLGRLEVTHTTFGHVSHRVPGTETMLIRAKGAAESGVRYTTAHDVVLVDFDANVIDAPEGLRAPSESFIHIWMYRTRPEISSVVHAHPRSSVALSVIDQRLHPLFGAYGYGSILMSRGIPIYDLPFTVDSHELGEQFASIMGSSVACLMRGHGITTVGTSLEAAAVTAIELERMSAMMLDALKVGPVRRLAPEEASRLANGVDPSRPRGTASMNDLVAGLWRYYARLAGE